MQTAVIKALTPAEIVVPASKVLVLVDVSEFSFLISSSMVLVQVASRFSPLLLQQLRAVIAVWNSP